jgi:hypothetical protein
MIAAEGAEPYESDFASIATKERKGDTPLGCSGRNSLKEGAVWRNSPMWELLKFRNLMDCDCATVAERCRALPPLPAPLFAQRVARLRDNTGWRNSKEGPRNLSDVTRNSTWRCVLRMSDSSVYRGD